MDRERIRRLAHVLWAANTAPISKMHFYPIKSLICQRFGVKDGTDLQRIVQTCWSCGGTGQHFEYDECYRCDGSGIYSSTYVLLQRWRVAEKLFHQPIERILYNDLGGREANIHDRIKHTPCSWSQAANLAIGRLFDRWFYWHCAHWLQDHEFGLRIRQCEAACKWVVGPDWSILYHALPAARSLIVA